MNRLEKHILNKPMMAPRLLSYDACQVQLILAAELGGRPGECTAAAVANAIGRHFYRMTFLRYHDSVRRLRNPLNPDLSNRLCAHVWRKLNPPDWTAYQRAVGRYQH